MSQIEVGTYGAKRQSMKKAQPRELLRNLIEENPKAPEQKLLSLFADTVRDDPEMIDAVLEYWFANNYRCLTFRSDAVERLNSAKRLAASVTSIAVAAKTRATRMVLLDMVMPNGKSLRDCTGADCAKVSGWQAKIAKLVKPSQKVGEVLSEAQVRKLLKP